METTEPFAAALRELLIENDYATQKGKPNLAAFAAELEGFHYETLRHVASGRRQPSPRLMEECARVLRIRPDYFLEYRILLAQRDFNPAAVGTERALENLSLWTRAKAARSARSALD